MTSVQHYKLSGDVVLRTINSSDVKNTFIFLDKRTGKCFTFDPTEFKFSETNLPSFETKAPAFMPGMNRD
jgi:hypothetical protein